MNCVKCNGKNNSYWSKCYSCARTDERLSKIIEQADVDARIDRFMETQNPTPARKPISEVEIMLKAEVDVLRGTYCGQNNRNPCGVCIKCAKSDYWCNEKTSPIAAVCKFLEDKLPPGIASVEIVREIRRKFLYRMDK